MNRAAWDPATLLREKTVFGEERGHDAIEQPGLLQLTSMTRAGQDA